MDVQMPRPHPPEFRQPAVELVRFRDEPVAQIAENLGISVARQRDGTTISPAAWDHVGVF